MEKKDVTAYYSLVMFTYSLGFVVLSAFSSFFLLDMGLSSAAIGILLAIGTLVAVLLEPVVGGLIDHNPNVTTRQVMLVLSGLIAVFGGLLFFLNIQSIAVKSALYGICILLLMLEQPFNNALGMDAVNYGYKMNLGVGRAMGSLGYCIGSYAFGIISVKLGPPCIPAFFALFFFVLVFLVAIYPVKKKPNPKTDDGKTNPFLFLLKYRQFGCMLLGLIFIYFSHSLINTFALQVVMSKGGTSEDMGTAAALASVCELVTTMFFMFYMRRFKLSRLIKISSLFFLAKILLSLLVQNVTGFFLIQPLQMYGWGIMAIGVVYYANFTVEESDKAQGQAYAGMSFTISSVLGTALGGTMIDALGVDKMLVIGTISAAIGAVIVWVCASEPENPYYKARKNAS